VWELEVPLRGPRFERAADVAALCSDFHDHHMDVFATCDRGSPIEVIGWRARVQCQLDERAAITAAPLWSGARRPDATRPAWFAGHREPLQTTVRSFDAIVPGEELVGPAIVESPVTTIVIEPGASALAVPGGSLVVAVDDDRAAAASVDHEVVA
jgi:N-methylhydantoinase A